MAAVSLSDLPEEQYAEAAKLAAEYWAAGSTQNEILDKLREKFKITCSVKTLEKLRKHPNYREVVIREGDLGEETLKALAARHPEVIVDCLLNEIKTDGKQKMKANALLVQIITGKRVDDEGPKQAQAINLTLATDDPTIKDLLKK